MRNNINKVRIMKKSKYKKRIKYKRYYLLLADSSNEKFSLCWEDVLVDLRIVAKTEVKNIDTVIRNIVRIIVVKSLSHPILLAHFSERMKEANVNILKFA